MIWKVWGSTQRQRDRPPLSEGPEGPVAPKFGAESTAEHVAFFRRDGSNP